MTRVPTSFAFSESNLISLCSAPKEAFPEHREGSVEKPRGGLGPGLAWLLTGCTRPSCPCSGSPGCTGSDGDSHPASGGEVSRAHASHTAAGSHLDTRILGESAGDTHSRSQAPTSGVPQTLESITTSQEGRGSLHLCRLRSV